MPIDETLQPEPEIKPLGWRDVYENAARTKQAAESRLDGAPAWYKNLLLGQAYTLFVLSDLLRRTEEIERATETTEMTAARLGLRPM